ncbi:rhomboid family intramembrane serine protease [Candidatus Dojkabacteria bacterium]|nr:rhomboid family intramembrane serine protease [Candidatus Dojkabacteria bacterium]
MELRFEFNTTNTLIFANVCIFIVSMVLAASLGSDSEALSILGADAYYYISNGQFWRVVTSSFLHANLLHLFVNVYALFILGSVFEKNFGGRKLFILYILSGITGSLLSFFVYFLRVQLDLVETNIIQLGVGASGALFGIMGYLLVMPYLNIDKTRLYYLLFLNLIIGIGFAGYIDNWAHLGGLLGGLLIGLADRNPNNNLGSWKRPDVEYYVSILVVLISYLAMLMYNIF